MLFRAESETQPASRFFVRLATMTAKLKVASARGLAEFISRGRCPLISWRYYSADQRDTARHFLHWDGSRKIPFTEIFFGKRGATETPSTPQYSVEGNRRIPMKEMLQALARLYHRVSRDRTAKSHPYTNFFMRSGKTTLLL